MKNSRFTDSQIWAILKQAEHGVPVPELCRQHGMSSSTFHKWRSKFGALDATMMPKLKELEQEHSRLNRRRDQKKWGDDRQIPATLKQSHNEYYLLSPLLLQSAFSAMRIALPANIDPHKAIKAYVGTHIEPFARYQVGSSINSMDAFSYTNSSLFHGITIGRYSSLAENVRAFCGTHSPDWISTSSNFFKAEYLESTEDLTYEERNKNSIRIGNDVWIGSHVALKNDITIGDGAIIGTGAVVTEDVPPFAVMDGVPARIIRFRFSKDIIKKIMALQWWKYALRDLKGMRADHPKGFLLALEQRINAGEIAPYAPKKFSIDHFLLSIKNAELVKVQPVDNQGIYYQLFSKYAALVRSDHIFSGITPHTEFNTRLFLFYIQGVPRNISYRMAVTPDGKKLFIALYINHRNFITEDIIKFFDGIHEKNTLFIRRNPENAFLSLRAVCDLDDDAKILEIFSFLVSQTRDLMQQTYR